MTICRLCCRAQERLEPARNGDITTPDFNFPLGDHQGERV